MNNPGTEYVTIEHPVTVDIDLDGSSDSADLSVTAELNVEIRVVDKHGQLVKGDFRFSAEYDTIWGNGIEVTVTLPDEFLPDTEEE